MIHFSARVTLKFDGWPRKITWHLFYTTWSFVHHFWSMGKFKLKLQSGNAQFGSKLGTSSILHQAVCIISKPWMSSNWSYSPETLNSGQNRQFFVQWDLEMSRITLKNNRAPLLFCPRLCASYKSHGWIQNGVTVRICSQFGSKSAIVCPVRPWNLTDDLERQ